MGEPVGSEYGGGDDCLQCWGLGKPFGDVDTPKYVYITWTGLVGGLAPANKTFIATQNPVEPAQWLFNDGIFSGNWFYSPGDSKAFITIILNPAVWEWIFGPICSLVCTDGIITCVIS